MNLVIIESVGKKDTIKKYLGSDYEVVATKGHIRDLPEKSLGVNVLDNFKPQYEIMPDKKEIVKALKVKSEKADKVLLATDPDREGEAISWHLCNILGMDETKPIRIVFNEISKNAVTNALKQPRPIDINLVDAQQARRVLDRLVGYKVSPILCKKIQPKLSAGRVQSATLKLVVDRENEIRKFKPEEYWSVVANLYSKSESDVFKSSLTKFNGKKAVISNKEAMDKVLEDLNQNDFKVKEVKKTIAKSHPAPPFTTSTMQQEALNKLGMNLKKVTACAQELYEGVEIQGEGKTALITYIRTDSVRLSPEAVAMARKYIVEKFGEKYLPKQPNVYKTKKSAQDAHEAIRPIHLEITPESVKGKISSDNYKLYKLIYTKFLACQMEDATFNSVVATIENGKYEFRASGKTPIFDGFMKLYETNKKAKVAEEEQEENDENITLPPMEEGDKLNLSSIVPTQKFTKPPARYSEATLVKEMEDKGIGRPATYSPTVNLLSSRKYVEKDGKFLKPTELGEKIHDFLEKYFASIVDTKFTASMEDKLDDVASKGIVWQDFVKDFYNDFVKLLGVADKDSLKFKIPPKETDIKCDKCGHAMVIRTGKYGEFLACSNFPACKNIQPIVKQSGICPKCGKPAVEKRSKKGNIFYGCSDYPNCDFVSWEMPLAEKCPKCGAYLTGKKIYSSLRKKCSNPNCGFTETVKREKNENK